MAKLYFLKAIVSLNTPSSGLFQNPGTLNLNSNTLKKSLLFLVPALCLNPCNSCSLPAVPCSQVSAVGMVFLFPFVLELNQHLLPAHRPFLTVRHLCCEPSCHLLCSSSPGLAPTAPARTFQNPGLWSRLPRAPVHQAVRHWFDFNCNCSESFCVLAVNRCVIKSWGSGLNEHALTGLWCCTYWELKIVLKLPYYFYSSQFQKKQLSLLLVIYL